MNWLKLAQEVVEGKVISNEEASHILHCDDDDLLLLMHRRQSFPYFSTFINSFEN